MKELTDKVNMDNLSFIIKTLRAKATSMTSLTSQIPNGYLSLLLPFINLKIKALMNLSLLKLNIMNMDARTLF